MHAIQGNSTTTSTTMKYQNLNVLFQNADKARFVSSRKTTNDDALSFARLSEAFLAHSPTELSVLPTARVCKYTGSPGRPKPSARPPATSGAHQPGECLRLLTTTHVAASRPQQPAANPARVFELGRPGCYPFPCFVLAARRRIEAVYRAG
jgi:hypothetical protein